jgi:hypothetical protein
VDLLVEVIQRGRVWCLFGQALSLWESTAPAGALVANARPAAATAASANLPMIFMAFPPRQIPMFHCPTHQDHRTNPAIPTVPRNSLAAWGQGKELT